MLYCPTGFPQRYIATLSTVQNQIAVDSSVGVDSYIYQMSAHPFALSVQMQGWDQLATVYKKFRPISAKMHINATVLPKDNNHAGNVMMRTIWKDNDTVWSTNMGVASDPYVKTTSITVQDGFKMVTTRCNLWTPHGMTRQQWMDDPNTYGLTEGDGTYTNPSRMTYFHLYMSIPALTTSLLYEYEIKFYITYEFFDRVPLVDA